MKWIPDSRAICCGARPRRNSVKVELDYGSILLFNVFSKFRALEKAGLSIPSAAWAFSSVDIGPWERANRIWFGKE